MSYSSAGGRLQIIYVVSLMAAAHKAIKESLGRNLEQHDIVELSGY